MIWFRGCQTGIPLLNPKVWAFANPEQQHEIKMKTRKNFISSKLNQIRIQKGGKEIGLSRYKSEKARTFRFGLYSMKIFFIQR